MAEPASQGAIVLQASAVVVDGGVDPVLGAPRYRIVVENWPRVGDRREVTTREAFGTHRLRSADRSEAEAEAEADVVVSHRTPAYPSWGAYLQRSQQ